MLVLTRFKDQKIIIDGNIEISILDVIGNLVRIGVEAPRNIVVDRQEIHERKQMSKKAPDYSGALTVANI